MVLLASLYVLFWPDPAGGGVAIAGADKVVHLLLFASLTATARLRFGGAVGVLAGALSYAVVSEVVQALLLSRRSGDLLDVGADLLGVALGWWLVGRQAGR